MSFYKRYELQRLIADGEAKTFRAIDNTTGRTVFLHMFNAGGVPLLELLKAKLARDAGAPKPPLVEIGAFAGAPYAVTETIDPFTNLRDWLGGFTDSPSASAPPRKPGKFTLLFESVQPGPQAAPPTPAPSGEFTQMFGVPPASPASTTPKPRTPAAEPGEFTRWFNEPPAAAPAKSADADEFEKLIGGPVTPEPASRQEAAWPSRSSGDGPNTEDFTGRFGLGPSGESINIDEEQARAAMSAPPESRPFAEPSEFTRMFGPQTPIEVPEPGPRTMQRPREAALPNKSTTASGIFGSREEGPGVVSETLEKKPKTEMPGEYTRMIAVPVRPPEPPADKSPASGPVATTKRSLLLWIGIPVLVLIVVVVIELVLVK